MSSIGYIIKERFDNNVEEIEKSKATTWLRWLFFILGPLPQAIRLAFF